MKKENKIKRKKHEAGQRLLEIVIEVHLLQNTWHFSVFTFFL